MNGFRVFALGVGCMAFLAGCAGTSRSLPAPSAPSSSTPTATVSLTISTRAAVSRGERYVSPNAKSVAISVVPGNPAYAATSGCVDITASVTTYTVQVAAPIGSDTFTIRAFDGPCTPSSSGGSAGTGNLLNTTSPIVGTVTASAANTLNPAGVAPAQPCPGACTIVISQVANAQATGATFAASLSTAQAGLATFEYDPGVTMGLPVAFALKDNAGNSLTSPDANGQTIPLFVPVTIVLSDTSLNARPGTLGLAFVNGLGNVYCPSPPASGSFTATFAAVATATCPANVTTATTLPAGSSAPRVALTLANAPAASDRLVIVYNGATQSAFQSATLTATAGATTLASIAVGGQPQVATQFAGPPSPVGIAASNAGNVEFVTSVTRVYAQTAGTTLGAGSNATAGATFTGITFMNAAAPAIYIVDPSCQGCDLTHVGIYQTGSTPATVNGSTPVQLTTTGGLTTNGFVQSIVPPFVRGPIGIVALSPAQGGAATFGSLLVAANNSIYRADLITATQISALTLVAGTGVAGVPGQGSASASSGVQAAFNFGTVTFSGMALDATASSLFFADPGNNAVRRISLGGTNAVFTYAQYASAPAGVALDTASGLLLTTHPSQNNVQSVGATGAQPGVFAGLPAAGSQDGLGTQPYPVQFNPGNAVANAAGTAVAGAYSGLYDASGTVRIGSNSNPGSQSAATFSGPQGIAVDPGTAPNLKFYLVDQTSGLVRTLF